VHHAERQAAGDTRVHRVPARLEDLEGSQRGQRVAGGDGVPSPERVWAQRAPRGGPALTCSGALSTVTGAWEHTGGGAVNPPAA
jgi:hypothetical protein